MLSANGTRLTLGGEGTDVWDLNTQQKVQHIHICFRGSAAGMRQNDAPVGRLNEVELMNAFENEISQKLYLKMKI